MPKLLSETDMVSGTIPGLQGFQYSAVRATSVALASAASYTLVTIAVDVSSSVTSFRDLLVDSIKKAVGACAKSPLAANIMVRTIMFNHDVTEVHGFKPLAEIDINVDYDSIQCYGATALYDACASALGATTDYGKSLSAQNYGVSGILFVITDGEDNRSRSTPLTVKQQSDGLVNSEILETFASVLAGVNAAHCRSSLERLQKEGGMTQYVDAGDATPGNLAKLAAFVSKSVSSTAQGTGTAGITI